jgi:hypothetical protein
MLGCSLMLEIVLGILSRVTVPPEDGNSVVTAHMFEPDNEYVGLLWLT